MRILRASAKGARRRRASPDGNPCTRGRRLDAACSSTPGDGGSRRCRRRGGSRCTAAPRPPSGTTRRRTDRARPRRRARCPRREGPPTRPGAGSALPSRRRRCSARGTPSQNSLRWHVVQTPGWVRASSEWRALKPARWTPARSGSSNAIFSGSMGTVCPWHPPQNFCAWQVAHSSPDEKARLPCSWSQSPSWATWLDGRTSSPRMSLWQLVAVARLRELLLVLVARQAHGHRRAHVLGVRLDALVAVGAVALEADVVRRVLELQVVAVASAPRPASSRGRGSCCTSPDRGAWCGSSRTWRCRAGGAGPCRWRS